MNSRPGEIFLETTSRRIGRNPIHTWPTIYGVLAAALLTALVIIGSRNLSHFDPALFGYTIASIVAFGAIVFRYALWLQRPATRAYWKRGWQLFREREKFLKNTASAVGTAATNL